MNWREELRPASFRGVPFEVRRHHTSGGRRTRVYEFPQRETPATDDMGRRAHRFQVEAFVLGEDYMSARNELLDALDAPGDGELIHPYFGSRTVAVLRWRVRESTRRGGMATFSIEFSEGGPLVLPDDAVDTGWAVQRAAEALAEKTANRFSDAVDTTGPEDVRTGLLEDIDNALDELSNALEEICSPIYQATETLTKIISIKAKAGALLAAPITLAGQLSSLLDAVFTFDLPNYGLLLSLFTSKSAFSTRSSYSSSPRSVLSTVGARIETNSEALSSMLRGSLLASAATAASEQDYDTYEDSLAVRTALLDALDDEASTADDAVYQALADVRTAVVRDFASGESLPRLTSYTPSATVPALALAHAIYGDATRADEIVTRNNVRHPGAVPGGTTLKVLTDA